MTDWSYKSWMAGVGAVALATCVAGGVVGCSKKKPDETKAKAEQTEKKKPQGDRYADGVRLGAAQKEWTKRWADNADLPPCEPLLKAPTDLELCKNAQATLATLKAAVAKPEPEAVLLHAAAELSFASEAASEKLRNAYMEKTQAEHRAAGPAGSGAPVAKPPSFAKSPRTRPLGSAGKAGLADKLKGVETAPLDPEQQLMQAYARVNRASLRYLSQFLQFGPLPTRNATFNELEALSHRKELWPALGRALREAAMTENDPTLQGKLKELAPKLSRRGPGGPNLPGMANGNGMPPGHPPDAEGAPPPAPSAP